MASETAALYQASERALASNLPEDLATAHTHGDAGRAASGRAADLLMPALDVCGLREAFSKAMVPNEADAARLFGVP